jgi:hypothetical protein
MKIYLYQIPDENCYVKVNRETLGVRRIKNINYATWGWTQSTANSWDIIVKSKFPTAKLISADIDLNKIEFINVK